ncbi:MAG: carbohydrate binding domain-containing protein [Thermoguttaceae bacterium]
MPSRRRGSIYIMTLGTALIVAVLAAAALVGVRAQRRQAERTRDILQATLNAHTAVEMSLFHIQNNSTWRTLLTNDTWASPATTRVGTCSFVGIDPDDGNLADDRLDPVLITATGTCQSATQKIEIRLRTRNAGLRCLEPVIHSQGNLKFVSASVHGNRLVSSNARTTAATASQIYVQAQSKLAPAATDGSVFHAGSTTQGTWPREMPAAAAALQYYLDHGTAIDAADLPTWDAQQIANPDMSNATTGWQPVDACTLTLDAAASKTPWSLLVQGRSGPTDGPAQAITEKIQSGLTYAVTADAKALDAAANLRISLRVTSTDSGTQTFSTGWTTVGTAAFVTLAGNLTPTWTGSVTEALWLVESETGSGAFWLDDAGMVDAGARAGFLAVHRSVLSSSRNPFGSGATNPQGIYVIDCAGSPISIRDSRIFGTLVLRNFDASQSLVHGAMSWEPAQESVDPRSTNLPILLADGDLQFATGAGHLDEGLLNVNLNPAEAPLEGVADSDKADLVQSLLDGMIYVDGDVDVSSTFRLQGVLVSSGIATFTGADVTCNYNPVYYWYNAPPGFEAAAAVDVVPGSYRRVVDP